MSSDHCSGNLPNDATLRFICSCGHRTEQPRVDNIGFIRFHENAGQFTATCPSCTQTRPTQVVVSGTQMVCVVAGTYRDESEGEDGWRNATYDGLPDPFELSTVEPFVIRCNGCEQLFDESDCRSDSNAPEVGWEYYDCPECGTKTRADIAEYTHVN